MKSRVGSLINSLVKYEIETPSDKAEFIGIYKTNKIILFELKNEIPIKVWKKYDGTEWVQEDFIGFPLISEYSVREFKEKKQLIENALTIQWDKVMFNKSNIHGDFTHFNILYDNNNNIHFIDYKRIDNSILFDFYYFYSYLKQSIYKSKILSVKQKEEIMTIIESIIIKTCNFDSKDRYLEEYNQLVIPNKCGISDQNRIPFLIDFFKLFDLTINN